MHAKRIFLSIAGLGLACGPALSRPLEVEGKAGYLSEWDVKAAVTPGAGGELSGPVTWRHTGLCTVEGPVEKSGILSFRISGSGPLARISATISFNGDQCSYRGAFSGETRGHMDCSNAKGIPLSLSIREAGLPLSRVRSPE